MNAAWRPLARPWTARRAGTRPQAPAAQGDEPAAQGDEPAAHGDAAAVAPVGAAVMEDIGELELSRGTAHATRPSSATRHPAGLRTPQPG